MQIKKFVATGLTAIMAGATLAGGALASGLQDYPGIVGNNGQLDAYVVVGANAAPSDVVGAIDVAANLASLSYTTTTVGTSTVGSAGNGIEKDGVTLGLANNPTTGNLATGPNAFPSITALKNAHYSGLWQGTFSYNASTISAHEEVDLSQGGGVKMRHDLGTSNINGTEKMVVGNNGNIIVRYKFDTNVANVGTISAPQYSKPVKISFLGKSFSIVGVGTNSIKMLSGEVGTAVRDGATNTAGVTFGGYTVYVTAGNNNDWSTLQIADSTGKVVDTLTNSKEGDTKTSSVANLDVKVTDIRVTGTDPATQHIEVDLVVGPTGAAEYEYDGTADTSSSSKERFPGEADWYITYSANSGSAGTIQSGASINAEYRPSSTQYLIAGQEVDLPNNKGTLKYVGFNTNSFSTVTIQPITSVTGYNSTDQSLASSTLYGLQISADGNSVGGGVGSPTWHPAEYLLFNQTVSSGGFTYLPVIVGYKNSKGNIQVNDTLTTTTIANLISGNANSGAVSGLNGSVVPETGFYYLNTSWTNGTEAASQSNTVTFPFKLNYNGVGDVSFWLNASVAGSNTRVGPFVNITLASANLGSSTTYGSGTSGQVYLVFNNRTTFTPDSSNLQTDLLKLGQTASSSETTEVNITTEGSDPQNAGDLAQEVVGDAGVLLEPTSSNGDSDTVVIKVPSKQLANDLFLGSTGTTSSTTTGGNTVNVVAPVVNAVAKLDTEITATEKASNLVLVGGPAVNSLTAQLMGVPAGTTGTASGVPQNAALIRIVRDAFTTGKVAVIVAGWEAADTRLATSVLQKAATTLAGQTADSVVVSGSVTSPVITAESTTTTTNSSTTQ